MSFFSVSNIEQSGDYYRNRRQDLRCGILILFLVVQSTLVCLGQGFESNLAGIYRLWEGNRYSELVPMLQRYGRGGCLEDLRLFLLGESLKNTGKESEALSIYEALVQKYPKTVSAHKAGLSGILLATKLKGLDSLPDLIAKAKALSTPYQRGRALEGLCAMSSMGMRQKSLIALDALREYRSLSFFYQNESDCVGILKAILTSISSWQFTPNEWIEITRCAIREHLESLVIQAVPYLTSALGSSASAVTAILEADALRSMGRKDRAWGLLNGVLAMRNLEPEILGLGYQIRGDFLHFLGRHSQAIADYGEALKLPQLNADRLATEYRLMRSAYEAGFDQESIQAATRLCKINKKIPLLPVHLYEMGLNRYDAGLAAKAVPYFLLLAKEFPGHYRADDALGYAAVSLGIESGDAQQILQLLSRQYPHSFFLYWLDPPSRAMAFPANSKIPSIPEWVTKRVPAWRALFKSPFRDFAQEEIRGLFDEFPTDLGVFKAAMDLVVEAGNYHLATGYGEILLKNLLDTGASSAAMPIWAWKNHYPRPYFQKVQTEATKNKIDPNWVMSIMREESHFNPSILSRSNAMGLMQILPSTGKWIAGKLGIKGKFNKDSLWNPDRNISFGAWYLAYLKNLFNGDLFLAAAAYNGGQGNIQRKVLQGPYSQAPTLSKLDKVPLPETRDYYKKVMGSWWNYSRIYK